MELKWKSPNPNVGRLSQFPTHSQMVISIAYYQLGNILAMISLALTLRPCPDSFTKKDGQDLENEPWRRINNSFASLYEK
jgi:hypothetical protein